MIKNYLIADIGGTNSRIAILTNKNTKLKISNIKKYKTNKYKRLSELLQQYMSDSKQKIYIEKAVLAIAGNIKREPLKLTNSNLEIDKPETRSKLNLVELILINDFVATAHSIEKLKSSDLKIINHGKKKENKTKVILGAGTGLGKAIIVYDEKSNQNLILSSEGGHNEFPFVNSSELEIVDFIKKKENKKIAEQEDLLSGKGIENIYEFFSNERLSAKEISGKKTKNEHAKNTFELFYKFLARVAKDFALEELAEGGVYLAGGIVLKNLSFSKKQFRKEFIKNNTYSIMLEQIPVYAIKNEKANLLGISNYIEKNNI